MNSGCVAPVIDEGFVQRTEARSRAGEDVVDVQRLEHVHHVVGTRLRDDQVFTVDRHRRFIGALGGCWWPDGVRWPALFGRPGAFGRQFWVSHDVQPEPRPRRRLLLQRPSEIHADRLKFSFRHALNSSTPLPSGRGSYNKTVTFFVSDQSPSNFAPNDTYGSVLGQARQALAVWNGVGSSDLRIAFGGLESYGESGIQQCGCTRSRSRFSRRRHHFYRPATWGRRHGSSEYGQACGQQPQWKLVSHHPRGGDALPGHHGRRRANLPGKFFTTAVHEIGHALGLQHTWTGSAMSQGVIRNTSRARPLDATTSPGFPYCMESPAGLRVSVPFPVESP